MTKFNSNELGYTHLLLIVAVFSVMGLMLFSNLQLMDQLSEAKKDVLGVTTTRGLNQPDQAQDPLQAFFKQIVKLIPAFK